MKKLSKSLPRLLIVAFVVIVGLAFTAKTFLKTAPKEESLTNLQYTLSPDKSELKVGEKLLVPVYISGDNVDTATAFDVKFTYDKTKLKLTGAKPGDFYEKYLTVKWEDRDAWYALAMTPTSPNKYSDPESPLLTLEFTAIGRSTSTSVSTAASTVYIAQTGGFHPQPGKATFKIQ